MVEKLQLKQISLLESIALVLEETNELMIDIANNTDSLIGRMESQINPKKSKEDKTKDSSSTSFFGKFSIKEISELSNSLNGFSDESIKKANNLITIIQDINEKIIGKVDLEKSKEFSGNLAILGSGIKSFGWQLALSVPFYWILEKRVSSIGNTITTFFDSLSNIDASKAENVSKSINALSEISGGLISFSIKMMILSPLLLIAIPTLKLLELLIRTSVTVFNYVNSVGSNIENSVPIVKSMGTGLLMFAGFLAISTVLALAVVVNPVGTLALFGMMALSAVVFQTIGMFGRQIDNAGYAVSVMGLSLFVFSGFLAISSLLIKAVNFENIAFMALTVGGFALIYSLIGTVAGDIALASLAVATIGISLLFIASPLAKMSKIISENPKDIWKVPLILGLMGGVYAIAGLGVLEILLGSVAFSAIGGSLWIIGKGMGAILNPLKDVDRNTVDLIGYTLKSIVTGIGKAFSDLSVIEIATLPLKLPMLLAMSGALIGIGTGVKAYKTINSNWTNEDADSLTYTISSLSQAFSIAGSTKGMSKFFGFPVGENDVERGIESTMRIGNNLTKLSQGIMAWKTMNITSDDITLIKSNLVSILTAIPSIFADIGAGENNKSRPFQSLSSIIGFSGFTYTQGDVERGIDSTMKLGMNLNNLASGVMAWKTMKITPTDLDLIKTNVASILHTIPSIFADIGASENDKSRPFASLASMIGFGGFTYTQGDVERGIMSTLKLGENLKSLSQGVMAWKEGGTAGFSIKDVPQIKTNIESILTSIPEIFAKIGSSEKESGSGFFWWQNGDIEKGVKTVNKTIKPLQSYASFIQTFKGIENPSEFGMQIGQGMYYTMAFLAKGAGLFDKSTLKTLKELVSPIERIGRAFKDINKGLEQHIKYLSKLDKTYVNNFGIWAKALLDLSKVDTSKLTTSIRASQEYTNVKYPSSATPSFSNQPNTPTPPFLQLPNSNKSIIPTKITNDNMGVGFQAIETALNNLNSKIDLMFGASGSGDLNDTIGEDIKAIRTKLTTGVLKVSQSKANDLGG